MTALPPIADFTASTVTEGQFKAKLAELHAYLIGLLGADGVPQSAVAALGALGAGHSAHSTSYTVAVADRGKVIAGQGTWTLGLPAVAAVGAGFAVVVHNRGTGAITIDPNGAELINGTSTILVQAGHGGVLYCDGTGWRTVGLLGGVVTQNSLDTTEGRVMRTGDFGLGTAIGTSPPVITLNGAVTPGLFNYLSSDPNGPSANSGMVEVTRYAGTNVRQVASAANTALRWQRTSANSGSSWTAWRPIYTSGNVLGAVGISGGEPTGSLIETGANGNGFWTKWADGTMECWREAPVNVATVALQTFAAPVAFVGARETIAASFSHLTASNNAALELGNIGAVGFTTSWFLRLKVAGTSADPLAYSEKLMLRAIGRWF